MRVAPPVLPGSGSSGESPIDRALSLMLAGEQDAALRWASAIVKADPGMPTALCISGRLLADAGRPTVGREALLLAIERAIDLENLPLAVFAAQELGSMEGDSAAAIARIAECFCATSPRQGDGAPPPPPLPGVEDFQPLHSVLTGPALVNRATEIVHEARRAMEQRTSAPGIAPQPLFSTLSQEALHVLCEALRARWVRSGEAIITEGDEGDAAFFVARGDFDVRRDHGGTGALLTRLSNGALIGEMALMSRAPRAASVIASRPSMVVSISRQQIEALAGDHPDLADELAQHCRARMVQNLVRMSDVLSVVPADERPALIERFQIKTFPKGQRLLTQGSSPEGLHLLASGEVAVVRRDPSGGAEDSLVLTTLGPGEVVGEIALVLRREVNADVVAVHPTVTLFLNKVDFGSIIREHPLILARLYQLACERDDATTKLIEQESVSASADEFVLI